MNFRKIFLTLSLILSFIMASCFFDEDSKKDPEPNFNVQHYALLNPDVVASLGDDYNAIVLWYNGGEKPLDFLDSEYIFHYENAGINEGRKASIELPSDWVYTEYLTANPDLGALTEDAAINHYLTAGIFENRPTKPVGPIDPIDPIDKSGIFRLGFVQMFNIYGPQVIDEIDFARYTHLILFSLIPNADGSLDESEWDNRTENLDLLVTRAHAANVSLWISVGGAGKSKNFAAVMSNPTTSDLLITNLVNFANKHNLDGVDIDWEYPETPELAATFAVWLQKLNTSLGAKTLSIDAPTFVHSYISAGSTVAPRDVYTKAHFDAVDYFNIMAYDMDITEGEVARYTATEATVNYWKDKGLDMSKTMLGVPFYGRDWSSGSKKDMTWSTYLSYKKFNPVDAIYFTSEADRLKKVDLIVNNNMGGIMYWEVTQDQKWQAQEDGTFTKPEALATWWDENLKARGK